MQSHPRLLIVGLDQIRLVPIALADGVQSVAWLTEAGRKVSIASGPPAPGTWREWMPQLPPTAYTGHTWSLDRPEACQHRRGDGGLVESTTDVW